jgi:hypothetical protein
MCQGTAIQLAPLDYGLKSLTSPNQFDPRIALSYNHPEWNP